MHVSVEINLNIIGSDMHVSFEIVAIGSDYACFSCNTLSWLKLSILHSAGKLNLARKTLVALKMVGVNVCFYCKGFHSIGPISLDYVFQME